MAELKTKKNQASVTNFLDQVSPEVRRQDGYRLLEIFKQETGEEPAMWGTSIIGYGSYHYKSERSTQEGDWPLTGFSPRKQSLSLYIMPGFEKYQSLLDKLGKHKLGKSCLYVNKLADIDEKILRRLIKQGYLDMKKLHPSSA